MGTLRSLTAKFSPIQGNFDPVHHARIGIYLYAFIQRSNPQWYTGGYSVQAVMDAVAKRSLTTQFSGCLVAYELSVCKE